MDLSVGPPEPYTPVPILYQRDPRFQRYIRQSSQGLCYWHRTRLKADIREIAGELKECDADEAEALIGSENVRIALDACRLDLPNWFDRMTEMYMSKVGVGKMPNFEVTPAVRGVRNYIIGLVGLAGAGKTMSALRIATGMAPAGDIVLIDTEMGRSTEYTHNLDPELPPGPEFNFQVLHMGPPYSPLYFEHAIRVAAKHQPRVLIIDSMSAEHRGSGGMLDMAASAPDNKHGRAWKDPRDQHRGFMNRLVQHPWFVIMTFQATPQFSEDGKLSGYKAIWEKTLPYDCSLILFIEKGGIVRQPPGGWPWKVSSTFAQLIRPDAPLDEELGRKLARWCEPQGSWETEEDDEA